MLRTLCSQLKPSCLHLKLKFPIETSTFTDETCMLITENFVVKFGTFMFTTETLVFIIEILELYVQN